jgi:hypothetical protein
VKPDQVDLAAYPVMTVLVIVLAAIAAIADENRIAAALAAIAIGFGVLDALANRSDQ